MALVPRFFGLFLPRTAQPFFTGGVWWGERYIQTMRHGEKVAICLAGGLALHTGASAVTTDVSGNPYAGIIDRNVFALKPAPPPPLPPGPPEQPPQKIVLTGIVNAWGKKQVLFKTPMVGKPGEAPKETSFMLKEGERAGEIEILEINEVLGTVRVKNHKLEQALSLKDDGMKPQGGPGGGPGALPGVPNFGTPNLGVTGGGVPNMGVPGSGVGPSLTPVPNYGGGAASIQRPLRVITPPTANAQAQAQALAQAQAQPKPMSPEEQVVMMEINRKLTAEKVAKGELPPIPDTLFTPKPAPNQLGP